jgi:Zn-dependent protease/CBS domain-containing protein
MRWLEVFKRKIVLMHVGGIPVRADYRWVFVLVLMSVVTAGSINATVDNTGASFLFGLMTTVVFFASILVHELAHAFTARMEGVQVMEIMLHPFGGLARMRHEPETPRAEFRIAIAGPAASFALALLFVLLMAAANAAGVGLLALLLLTLAVGNFLIAVFNLVPGYPLDGGRVLRAYLWRHGKELDEATVLTGRCGQVIAGLMFFFGIAVALTRADFFTGFWTVLVGLFLYDSATSIIREVNSLERVRVQQVMRLPAAVEPEANILHFVDHILSAHRATVYPVAKDGQLYGILMLEDIKKLERGEWHTTRVGDVMRPIEHAHFVEMHTPLPEAREIMHHNGIGAVAVVDGDGKLVGFLSGRHTRGHK